MPPIVAPPPSLRRRFASILYESLLLLGVLFLLVLLFFAGTWIFGVSPDAPKMRQALQAWLFVTLGLYFAWCWSHGGQTLPMKTWRIRLETATGGRVPFGRALLRYMLAWLCLVPGLILADLSGLHGWKELSVPLANLLLWALAVYLDPQRQFLHDRLAGTRLTDARAAN